MKPESLLISENIISQIPPRPLGYSRNRETFDAKTGTAFDPLSAAESVAELVLGLLLHPHRTARMIEYNGRNENLPGFSELVDDIVNRTLKAGVDEGLSGEIQRMVNKLVIKYLINLAIDEAATHQTRAICYLKLDDLNKWMSQEIRKNPDLNQFAFLKHTKAIVEKYINDFEYQRTAKPVVIPAGSPIGTENTGISGSILCDF